MADDNRFVLWWKKTSSFRDFTSVAESWNTMWTYKADMFLWLLFNVIVGAIPIIFVFVIHMIAKPQGSVYESIIKGDLMIFLTSLSATSISLYLEITGEYFWDSRRVAVSCLILIIIFSSMLYALLSFSEVRAVLNIQNNSVINLSVFMFVATIVICLHLFAMRFSVSKIDDIKDAINKPVADLTEASKTQTTTSDGATV